MYFKQLCCATRRPQWQIEIFAKPDNVSLNCFSRAAINKTHAKSSRGYGGDKLLSLKHNNIYFILQ